MKPLTLHAEIEILAAPAVVRSKFINFAGYSKWQSAWDILVQEQGKEPLDLHKGDKLSVSMGGGGFRFSPTVVENTPDVFVWDGALPYAFTGRHYFKFEPSKVNPGGTTLIQHEDFFGPLITTCFWFWSGKEMGPSPGWIEFNEAIKKEAETAS